MWRKDYIEEYIGAIGAGNIKTTNYLFFEFYDIKFQAQANIK